MKSQQSTKEFIVEYINAMMAAEKTPELCDKYMTDGHLKEHILFFDTIFPGYEVFADEMIAEGNRVVIRARLKGRHEGEFNGIPPTFKQVEFPFVVCYTIENNMITDHWLIADQAVLMEQLGVATGQASKV